MQAGGVRAIRLLLGAFVVAGAITTTADAAPLFGSADPWRLCADAIARQDRTGVTPRHLLSAISLNESGRTDPATGRRGSWPWAVMAEGQGRYLPTKAAAIAEVRGLQARGIRNIDVGCMQINLYYHPDAFASLEAAFDPATNVAYAADYLRSLYEDLGSWPEAAGRYHSATPGHKLPYQARVMATWEKQRRGGDELDDEVELAAAALPGAARAMARTRPAAASLLRRQPTPEMVDRMFQRQLQMPMVRRGGNPPTLASASQPGLVRLPPRAASADPRSSKGSSEFASRRMQYMEAWRQARSRGDTAAPVTVVRGTAENVYSFDLR
jgi:hypothetical protein